MHPRGPLSVDPLADLSRYVLHERLFSLNVLSAALLESLHHPVRTLKSFKLLLKSRNTHVFFKNIAVFLKGLWLAVNVRMLGVEHIHAHWASTTATMALIASEQTAIPWSFTAHRWDIVDNNLLQVKLAHSSFSRFISNSAIRLAQQQGVRVLPDKSFVLHMGVTLPDEVGCRSRPTGKQIIFCPANLIPVKGHKYLIEACSILQSRGLDFELWIAGTGILRDALEKQVNDLELTDVCRFLGQLPHSDVLSLYQQGSVSVVVLPSIDMGNGLHEGIPVALMEAMCFSVPVVSTYTGGISELLEGGGVLVPAENPAALAAAIEKLVLDDVHRDRIAKAGRERVETGFSVKMVVSELLGRFKMCNAALTNRT